MSADLTPGETKEISVETTCSFRAERLCIAVPPRPWPRRVLAFALHLPRAAWLNLRALGREVVDVVVCLLVRRPRRRHLSWDRRPGWKPPPYFPVVVINFRVGPRDQFRTEIPSELFRPDDVRGVLEGDFDVAPPCARITLVVRSLASRPFTFRAGIIGTVLD